MKFRIHDKVFCKVRGNTIVSAVSGNYEAQLYFQIIGSDVNSSKYLIFIPVYYNIKGSLTIKEEHLDKFSVDSQYLDCKGITLMEDRMYTLKSIEKGSDGIFCANCQQFFYMAEPNQTDGTFVCFQCRTNPWR